MLSVTVVVTTKNRRDELRQTLASIFLQDYPLRCLVIDDGSSDGTADMVRAEYPLVELFVSDNSLGLVVQRNRGAALAHSDLIFSLDDDAIYTSSATVRQTVEAFAADIVAAVAMPFVNVRQDDVVRQRAPDIYQTYVAHTFIGTAHALRRDVFLHLGGYREVLFHWGEERDLCIRMLAAGYVTRLGSSPPIHHFESLKRDFRRVDIYGRRNDVLFAWHNVPYPHLPLHVLGTVINGVRAAVRYRRLRTMMQGLGEGFVACYHERQRRAPVPRRVYRLQQQLKRSALPLEQVRTRLPPCGAGASLDLS